ncbi:pilus motility taxis protein HmpF [Pseudanabaena sp. PCC 6802]|uniref:pilus motility taxis protein HmpF n=1 Tax=Pseudanabaena sp. PCC 6802 TaxID=118173 RepID=UPI00034DB19D|nr:pilus motility taxis protein HmpF [Pseudanabaena sp. PCC 6802]
MQYLAEVRKTQAMLSARVEIRLLARNTSENNWQAVGSEEILTVQDANQTKDLKDGQLVLAEVNANKQVQGVQDATKRLVLILQTFTRAQEKFRQSEEDIEQWKQSLNYQSQELHRREMELEQKEQELEYIDAKRQEVDALQEELRHDREEFEQWRQQFEAAQREFEAQAGSSTLSQEQADYLREIAQRIAGSLGSGSLQGVSACLEQLYNSQEVLTQFWQTLELQRSQSERLQDELNRFTQDLNTRKQQWQQAQVTLTDAQGELRAQTEIVRSQESNLAMAQWQLEAQQELLHQANQIVESFGGTVNVLSPEEVKELEEMPLDRLEAAVENWQQELDKTSNYVGAQEDELASLEGEIAEIQSRIEKSSDFTSIELESEKEFKEEEYKMLDETLAGQRRAIQERQAILNQQRSILEKRQGIGSPDSPAQSLVPLVEQIETNKQNQEQELKKVESTVATAREVLRQQEDLVNRMKSGHQQNYQEIQTLELQLQEKIRLTADLVGRVAAQQDILRPVQDVVDALRGNLESIVNLEGSSESVQEQQQLVEALQSTIDSLIAA